MNKLTFAELRRASEHRNVHGFKQTLSTWSVAEWGNAAAGELGEAFEAFTIALLAGAWLGKACNTAKKILRFRDGVSGNKKTEEEYRRDLASEIAGTVIYLDLWAASQGIDLAQAICDEFNKKSNEIGYPGMLKDTRSL